MAWGMKSPKGIGDYFPNGGFVGWKEPLEKFVRTQMDAAEKAKYLWGDRLLFSEFSAKFTEDRGRLLPIEQPKKIQLHEKPKNLAAIIETSNRLMAVTEQVRDIVEAIEPEVHQFWPLEVVLPSGEAVKGNYFGMVVHQHLDTLRPNDSGPDTLRERSGRYYVKSKTKKGFSEVAISKEAAQGAHLWRDQRLTEPPLIVSDALMDRLRLANLRLPRFHQLREV